MSETRGFSEDSVLETSSCEGGSRVAGSARHADPAAASRLFDKVQDHSHDAAKESRAGVFYGIAAFGWWGLIIIYFKAVAQVPAFEVLAHRVFFSTLLLWGLLLVRGQLRAALGVLRNPRHVLILLCSTLLLACNWVVFIWAVAHNHVTQASLGYFINPLLNVVLGYAFLSERLRPLQKLSVLLAGIGVTILAVHLGEVPTIALALPLSFGLYGLIRKVVRIDAIVGLTVETTLLAPVALGYVVALTLAEKGHLGTVSLQLDLLLVSSGIVTAVPLIWFLHAARELRLSTLGFLQYITPSMQLGLGVLAYGEPFTTVHALSFGFVWGGLAVYAAGQMRKKDAK